MYKHTRCENDVKTVLNKPNSHKNALGLQDLGLQDHFENFVATLRRSAKFSP